MKITVSATGVSTARVRELAAACATAHAPMPQVGCDGAESWRVSTAPLAPNQFAHVFASVVKVNGTPLTDLSENVQLALGELGEAQMKTDPEAIYGCIERATNLLRGTP